jgi:hypothetical protein
MVKEYTENRWKASHSFFEKVSLAISHNVELPGRLIAGKKAVR